MKGSVQLLKSSVVDPDPDSTGSLDPDLGGQKCPTKKDYKCHFLSAVIGIPVMDPHTMT